MSKYVTVKLDTEEDAQLFFDFLKNDIEAFGEVVLKLETTPNAFVSFFIHGASHGS